MTSMYELTIPSHIAVNDHIELRLLQPDDAGVIFQMLQDNPEIAKRVTWVAQLQSVNDVRQKIGTFLNRRELRYAIVSAGSVVGYIGARPEDGYFGGEVRDDEYHIGYFTSPESRRQGLIKASVPVLMCAIQQLAHVRWFALYINDDNAASRALAIKLGFEQTDEVAQEPVLHCSERRYEKRVTND